MRGGRGGGVVVVAFVGAWHYVPVSSCLIESLLVGLRVSCEEEGFMDLGIFLFIISSFFTFTVKDDTQCYISNYIDMF